MGGSSLCPFPLALLVFFDIISVARGGGAPAVASVLPPAQAAAQAKPPAQAVPLAGPGASTDSKPEAVPVQSAAPVLPAAAPVQQPLAEPKVAAAEPNHAVAPQQAASLRASVGGNTAEAAGPGDAGGVAAVHTAWRPTPSAGPLEAPSAWWRLWLALYSPQLARLLTGLNFAGIIKVLCMAGNVLVQVSPYPQVKRWESRGCTGEADAAPYVSIAFGGWQWCFYGAFAYIVTKRSGFLILVHSNCLGAVLGTYYTAAFHKNCRDERSLSSLNWYLSAVSTLALLQVCAFMVLPAERALFLSGLISSFCSFVGAISMLVTVPVVMRTRDSRSIPGPMVFANFLSALVWCLCGWMLADPLVIGPNVVSALASLVCMYMKVRFPTDSKIEDDEEEEDETARIVATMSAPGAKSKKMQMQMHPTEFTPLRLKKCGGSCPVDHAPRVVEFSDGTGGTF